jgi:hypothetical protein
MHSVVVRMILYVLSPVLATGAALLPGWGVAYAEGVLSVHLETLVAAIVAAAGLSGAVFARWGIR